MRRDPYGGDLVAKLHALRNEIRGHATNQKKEVAIREARTSHGNFRAHFHSRAARCDKALDAVLDVLDPKFKSWFYRSSCVFMTADSGKQGQHAIELRALALKLRTAGVLILNARSGQPINLNIDLHINLNYDSLNNLKTGGISPWQLPPQIWRHRWNS